MKVSNPGNGTKAFSASYSDVAVRKYRPAADYSTSMAEAPKRSPPVKDFGKAGTTPTEE